MEFSITKSELDAPLKTAAGACGKSRVHPVLENVLIEADEQGQIRITGTDTSIEVVTQAPARVSQGGAMAVPAKKLRDICGAVDTGDTEIRFTPKGGQIQVKAGKSRFTLRVLEAEQFPNIDLDSFALARQIPEASLKALFAGVTPAMAANDVRYYLNGLYLSFEGETLTAAATDGHRLNVDQISAPAVDTASYSVPGSFRDTELGNTDGHVIVPREAISGMSRLLGHGEANVLVGVSANHVQIRHGNTVYTTKRLEGQYPNYHRVIPDLSPAPIKVNVEAIKGALERVRILAHEAVRGVKLDLSTGQIEISGANADNENAQEVLEVEYAGEAMTIGFNVDYLLDALKAVRSETAIMHMAAPNSSGMILPDDPSDPAQFIVMPMRL